VDDVPPTGCGDYDPTCIDIGGKKVAVVLPMTGATGAYSRRCEAEGVLHLREHRVFVCRRAEI